MGKISKAGDLISGLFRQHFDEETLAQARKTAGLFGSWEEITQRAKINSAFDHSRIREFEKGVLVIEAEHPGWVQLLQTKQNIILNILQKKYPDMKIQGLCFYLSKAPFPGTQGVAVGETDSASSGDSSDAASPTNASADIELPAAPFSETRLLNKEPVITEENRAIHESFLKFKKVIEKRNRRNPHK